MPSLLGVVLFALITSLLASCNSDDPSHQIAPASVARDSSGITIVENAAPARVTQAPWRVGGRPRLRIGAVDGDEEYSLGRVRSAWRLNDGRIVIADEFAHAIRFYSPRGKFLRSAGRDGEGPGEFRTMWHVRPYRRDSLFVFDYSLDRASIFDSQGRFARSIRIITPRSNYWAISTLADSMLALVSPQEGGQVVNQPVDSSFVLAYRDENSPLSTLGRHPVYLNHLTAAGQRQPTFYSPYASQAFLSDRYYWGLGDRWEIGEYDLSGKLVRLIRLDRPAEVLTEERKAAFVKSWPPYANAHSGGHPEGSIAHLKRSLERSHFPKTIPAFSRMIVDPIGNLWVLHYRMPSEPHSTWSVFDRNGRWLGEVEMPRFLEVEQIGEDFVLGIRVDPEDGVQYVEVYPLQAL